MPTIDELRERWDAEWAVVDAWLPTVTDGFVGYVYEGVPVWQMLVHVVNHGTQHRAEAASLLTAEGRSPGELDLMTTPGNRPRPAAVVDEVELRRFAPGGILPRERVSRLGIYRLTRRRARCAPPPPQRARPDPWTGISEERAR